VSDPGLLLLLWALGVLDLALWTAAAWAKRRASRVPVGIPGEGVVGGAVAVWSTPNVVARLPPGGPSLLIPPSGACRLPRGRRGAARYRGGGRAPRGMSPHGLPPPRRSLCPGRPGLAKDIEYLDG
jgi:hypothetical protein